MKEVGWADFHEKVKHRFLSDRCPVRKAIYAQLIIIADKDGDWATHIESAKRNAPVDWGITGSASLKQNFRRGQGDRNIATAIYFWFHSTEGLKSYAQQVDVAAFGQAYEEEFNDEYFCITQKFQEEEHLNENDSATTPEYPGVDIDSLKKFLKKADLKKQKYPSLILLMIEIEEVLQMSATLSPKGTILRFRGALNQGYWLKPENIIKKSPDSFKWEVKNGRRKKFSVREAGSNFVLVKDDGTRVSSDALHGIHTWLKNIWLLYTDGIIKLVDIDIFIRYILVFVQYRRSDYIKDYFNDDAGKIDIVLRLAVRRAKQLGLNLRDYTPIDEEYRNYYHSIKEDI